MSLRQLSHSQIVAQSLLYYCSILSLIGLGNYLLAWTYRLQLFRIPFYDQPYLIDLYLKALDGKKLKYKAIREILKDR